MPSLLNLSFAICTYGGSAKIVSECIESIIDEFNNTAEILVVHEADDDQFSEMKQKISQFPDSIRLIRLSNGVGLSSARNLALESCSSEWIAFVDDDATIRDGWSVAFNESILEFPDSAGFTGPILPLYAGSRKLPQSMEWLVSCNSMIMNKHPVRNGYGANMVFNIPKVRENSISFRKEFGWVQGMSSDSISGEETIFSSELTTSTGSEIMWIPNLSVNHHVPEWRVSLKYVWNRSYKEGKTKAVLSRSDLSFPLTKEKGHIFRIFFYYLPSELLYLPIRPFSGIWNIFAIFTMLFGTLSGFFMASLIRK